MVKALDRKLFRDLVRLRGQAATIAFVIACGIVAFVTYRSAWVSLHDSRAVYYERYRFADAFAQLDRAPRSVAQRLESIEGIARVYPRIVEYVRVVMPGILEPATGLLVSVPKNGEIPLNGLMLRRGRMLDPLRTDEVVVGEPFANAHGLEAGDSVDVIVNGRMRHVRVVGVAISPEFVFSVAPGSFLPDDRRFTPMWMSIDAVGPAFSMKGAFNDVAFQLEPGAQEAAVLDAIDRILEPYGGRGAFSRERHSSDAMLRGEIQQIESMVVFMPAIFLGVAAFLLNVVLSRLVFMQRPQIAALKALGYSNRRIALHYVELVTIIVLVGAGAGLALGAWLGREMTELYSQYYHVPILVQRIELGVTTNAILASMAAAFLGAMLSVRGVIRLSPAEAMRPPAPARYRRTFIERSGMLRIFSHSARMVLREIVRRPMRTVVSSLGISMAIAILVLGRFGQDALEPILDLEFRAQQREDVLVTFPEAVDMSALVRLGHMPGVRHVEGLRHVAVRLVSGQHHRETMLTGVPKDAELRRLYDRDLRFVPVPEEGVMLSAILADVLEVGPGDEIMIEVREGDRRRRPAVVSRVIDDAFGLHAYMPKRALHRFLSEEPRASVALLSVDQRYQREVQRRIREIPKVMATTRKATVFELFQQQNQERIVVVTLILTLFAGSVAVGVVYNNARVALSMRARDLASLRVLGFTRREISAILLGEQAIQVVLAIPLGLWLGGVAAEAIVALQADPETWRLPLLISTRTYAFATLTVLVAAVLSALLVRRKLDQLDLIGVLKTRE